MKHRSAEAIRFWLITRIWYNKYRKNLLNEYPDELHRQSFLYGFQGEQTLSGAFCYSETPEGTKFWAKREERFLRWYYYQGKEIFRCKWFTIQIK